MIIAIAAVWEEADVVESFVRHTLGFVDRLYIEDTGSEDGTSEVIAALQQEGLPVRLFHTWEADEGVSSILTKLMHRAFLDGADLVLPLESDGFLLGASHEEMRRALASLQPDRVYSLMRFTADVEKPAEAGIFYFAGTFTRAKNPEAQPKVIVGRTAWEKTKLRLSDEAYHALVGEGRRVVPEPLYGLYVTRFPWRSLSQMKKKVASRWLAHVAKNSVYAGGAHASDVMFRAIKAGEEPPFPHIEEGVRVLVPKEAVAAPPRYGKLAVESIGGSYALAEKYAQRAAEERFLAKQELISIILPFDGDMDAFVHSFQSAVQTVYPRKEYIVFSEPQESLEELQMFLSAQDENLAIALILDDHMDSLFAEIGKSTHGKYIQWIPPGKILRSDKLRVMGTLLAAKESFDFVVGEEDAVDGEGVSPFVFQPGDRYATGDGDTVLEALGKAGSTLAQSPAASLFRREAMEAVHFMRDAFDCGYSRKQFWRIALAGAKFGALHETFVKDHE